MSLLALVQNFLEISDKLVSIAVGIVTLCITWKAARDKKNHRERTAPQLLDVSNNWGAVLNRLGA